MFDITPKATKTKRDRKKFNSLNVEQFALLKSKINRNEAEQQNQKLRNRIFSLE